MVYYSGGGAAGRGGLRIMKLAIAQMVLGTLIVVDFLSFGLLSGIAAGSFHEGWWRVFYFHNFLGFFVLLVPEILADR